MDINYVKIFEQFKDDLTAIVTKGLVDKGLLPTSELVKSIEFVPHDSGIRMLANDYYEYVSTGRKPKARKVPINDLIDWIKRYRIGSANINQTAWAIQQSIYVNGIKGKNYEERITETVAEFSAEQLATILSEIIAEDMVAVFDPLVKK